MRSLRFDSVPSEEKKFSYQTIIIAFFVFLFLAIAYIWSHVRVQQIEYRLAAAKSKTEQLHEEQKRLQLEYSHLASPKRIEEIAIKELHMRYPQPEQTNFINISQK